MLTKKLVRAVLIIAGIVLIYLIIYFTVPVTYLQVNSIDAIHNFSPDNELLLDELSIVSLVNSLDSCTLWRTFYDKFPNVSGIDVEILMTGIVNEKLSRVQVICYTDGQIYFRIGDDRTIYTTYQAMKKDLINSMLF